MTDSKNPNRDDIRKKIEQELASGGKSGDKPKRRPQRSQKRQRPDAKPYINKKLQRNPQGIRPGKRPPMGIMTTTLWEYPSQHYDASNSTMQGSKDYIGATPSWVIYQLLKRYTKEHDTVIDPMCGSGTTIDVCKDLNRKPIAYDLNPQRPDIKKNDSRKLPLEDDSVDFAFIDPPYSTHVDYSDDDRCIGKLDAGQQPEHDDEIMGHDYYEAMDSVLAELYRVLKPGKYLGLYVSDSWKKKKGGAPGEGTFMPIGFELFAMMSQAFTPVDIICVVRHNTKLQRGNWHKAAEEENFFLRGFNYLLIMKKLN
jgi:adenine-specific DNA-methyltransferase